MQAVRSVISAAPGAVAAIGLSGQMHGVVLLDAQHQPVAPAVIWPDGRSGRQVQAITQLIGAERLYAITGSPLSTGFLAATVRWFQEEAPALWRQTAMLLLPKDYLRWRLTGALATDPSDAAGALLLDERRRDWSDELLAALQIERGLLPPVQPADALAGLLTAAAAAELGLPAGIPVITGAADTACSALGAGVFTPDRLLLTISTGGQLVQPVEAVQVDSRGRIHTFCSALEPGPGRAGWYQMGATLGAGLALRWLRDSVLGWRYPDAYDVMNLAASNSPPGAQGLLFLPYLVGERTPHMDPAARGVFFGLSLRHDQGDLIRAVQEGVTFALYDAYTVLAELGVTSGSIILAGGVPAEFVYLQEGETRTNVVIQEPNGRRHIKANQPGATVSAADQEAFWARLRTLARPGDLWVLTGSLAPGLPPAFYAQAAEELRHAGAQFVLDTSGPALRRGCAARPALVKPNALEAEEFTGSKIHSPADAAAAAGAFLEAGAQRVILSLGKDGAIVAGSDPQAGNVLLHVQPPAVTVQTAVGAGDAVVAGAVWAMQQGLPLAEIGVWGVATGTLTAMYDDLPPDPHAQLAEIAAQVQVRALA